MSASQKPLVGFVGLGAMGFGMATHLVEQGYPVKGYDVFPQSVERFKAAGGRAALSLADSANGVMYHIVMVATSVQAQSAIFDDERAIIKALPRGATLLLCSTVDSAYAKSVQEQLGRLDRNDIYFIDCPVSGGAIRAANGTLSIMVGASDTAIEKGRFLLAEMADTRKLFIVPGGIGQGSNMKMVHQVLAGCHILAASEAMGFAARLGLDAKQVRDAIIQSDAWSWMYENRSPRILQEDYYPGVSATTIILKDVGIITSMARLHNFPTPLCSTAEQAYLLAVSQGMGGHDDAGMVRLYYPDPISRVSPIATVGDNPASKLRLVLQLLASIHIASAAESIAYAKHVGIDLGQFFELASDAAGGSVMFRDRGPDMIQGLNGDPQVWSLSGRSPLDNVVNDLSVVVQEARKLNCPMFMATETLNLFVFAQRRGWGRKSDASIIRLWEASDR